MPINEKEVIEDYTSGLSLAKLYKKHEISAFELGMILGKNNVVKRAFTVYRYPADQARVRKDGSTVVPREFRADFTGSEMVTWTREEEGVYTVTVTS